MKWYTGKSHDQQKMINSWVKVFRIITEQKVSLKMLNLANYMVPTSSGNHGKPGKSLKKVPCMEKWNLKKPE